MKKFISILISICMLYSFATISFADYTSDVIISAPAESFNVTVPTQLPVSFDKEGTATYATDAAIVNNSSSPVKVSAITIAPVNGWTRETGTFTNTRQFDMMVSMASSDTIDANSSQYINYSVRLPKQKTALSNAKIATVIFTIGWADSSSESPYAIATTSYLDTAGKCWLSIARYNDYTLLLSADTTDSLCYPEGITCVAYNESDSFNIPTSDISYAPFSLSEAEYLLYCNGIANTTYDYYLRTTEKYVDKDGKITQANNYPKYRPASWVKTSSLPSTTS